MDVDSENFEEAFAIFKRCLGSAAFVALDCEFTGIRLKDERRDKHDDSPEVRYQAAKEVAERYSIMQVGLCLFEEVDGGGDSAEYVCRPFNFFVFPQPVNDGLGDKSVCSSCNLMLDADAMHFCLCHGLDFGRWVRHGVTYVDAPTEKQLRSVQSIWTNVEKSDQKLPKDLADEIASIGKALKSGGPKTERQLPGFKGSSHLTVFSKLKEFVGDSLGVELRPGPLGGSNPPEVWAVNVGKDSKGWEKEAKARAQARFNSQLGFRRLWSLFSAPNSPPLVIHNGLLDVLYAVNWFEGPLPTKFQDFRSLVSKVIQGGVYDTKWLSSYLDTSLGKKTSLPELISALEDATVQSGGSLPGFRFPSGFEKYEDDSGGFHEAGWDAYATGRLFAYYKQRHPPPAPEPLDPREIARASAGKKGDSKSPPKSKGPVNRFALLGGDDSSEEESEEEAEKEEEQKPKAKAKQEEQKPKNKTMSLSDAQNRIYLQSSNWDLDLTVQK